MHPVERLNKEKKNTVWFHGAGDCDGPVFSIHTYSLNVEAMFQTLIHIALEASEGNRSQAARRLGINVRTLRRRLNGKK